MVEERFLCTISINEKTRKESINLYIRDLYQVIFGFGLPRTRHCNSTDEFFKPTRYVSGKPLKRGGTNQIEKMIRE